MKEHVEIYMTAFGYDTSDFVGCEICDYKSNATHHIEARKMGGRPNNDMDRIENLMAICRPCDVKYGDKKEHKASLFRIHKARMYDKGVKFDSQWIDEQIIKHG